MISIDIMENNSDQLIKLVEGQCHVAVCHIACAPRRLLLRITVWRLWTMLPKWCPETRSEFTPSSFAIPMVSSYHEVDAMCVSVHRKTVDLQGSAELF